MPECYTRSYHLRAMLACVRIFSRRMWIAIGIATAWSVFAVAPHLLLPAPPMLSREGRIGACMLLGAFQSVVVMLLVIAMAVMPRRWAPATQLVAAGPLAAAATAALVLAAEPAFLAAHGIFLLGEGASGGGIGERIMHALNATVRPNVWAVFVAVAGIAFAAWHERRH